MENSTILVTGGAGYIGSHACRLLSSQGYRLVILDNLVYGHREFVENLPGVTLIKGSLLDTRCLRDLFRRNHIDAVIHFAAYAYVGESVVDPGKYYENNVGGSINLLNAMQTAGVSKLVFSSTCATYGMPPRLPITESTPQQPINPYGRTKLMVERVIRDFAASHGLRSVIFRYFNAAGADPEGNIGEDHDPETHLIPRILLTALGHYPHFTIYGTDYETRDGTCVRDYIHVADLATAHVTGLRHLLDEGDSLTLNLGTNHGYTVREVVQAAERVVGETIPVVEDLRREGDPPSLVADARLARESLGWQPRYTDIDSIVAHAWAWHAKRHTVKVLAH